MPGLILSLHEIPGRLDKVEAVAHTICCKTSYCVVHIVKDPYSGFICLLSCYRMTVVLVGNLWSALILDKDALQWIRKSITLTTKPTFRENVQNKTTYQINTKPHRLNVSLFLHL